MKQTIAMICGAVLALALMTGAALWPEPTEPKIYEAVFVEPEPELKPFNFRLETFHIAGTKNYQYVVMAWWEFYDREEAVEFIGEIK